MKTVAIGIGVIFTIVSAQLAASGANTMLSYMLQNIGGSVVGPLVSKCNESEYDSTQVTCEELMKKFGKVGAVRMYRPSKTKVFSKNVRTGYFDGVTTSGDFVSGDVYERRNFTRTKDLSWKIEVPEGFYDVVKKIEGLAKMKDAEACAEMGAIIFSRAMKGRMGYSDKKMMDYFKRAAILGDQRGKFMQGFCLYHGIGVRKDTRAASEIIVDWAVTNSVHTGWAGKIMTRGENNK